MHYRLATIAHASRPQSCGLCHRRHRVVVTFREVCIHIPEDPELPVSVSDGPATLTVGSSCARKVLDRVPVAYLGAALRMLDAAKL